MSSTFAANNGTAEADIALDAANVLVQGELSVPPTVETTLVSHTVTAGKTAFISGYSYSGDNVGKINVYVNGAKVDTQRTAWTRPSDSCGLGGLRVGAGIVIEIKAVHTNTVATLFAATLFGKEL